MAAKHGKAKPDLNRGNLERCAQYARKAADRLDEMLKALTAVHPAADDMSEWADGSHGLEEVKAALGDALTELGE